MTSIKWVIFFEKISFVKDSQHSTKPNRTKTIKKHNFSTFLKILAAQKFNKKAPLYLKNNFYTI